MFSLSLVGTHMAAKKRPSPKHGRSLRRDIGFAWPSHDAAVADAQDFIDRMQWRA
jgi:hypothetical protein